MNQLKLKQRFLSCACPATLAIILASGGVGLSAHAEPIKTPQPSHQSDAHAPVAAKAADATHRYAVQPGQSLRNVARDMLRVEEGHTDKEQAVLRSELFKANPRAFIAGNPDRLKKGAVLVVPAGYALPHSALPTASTVKAVRPVSAVQAQPQSEAQSQSQPQVQPEVQPEVQPQTQPQVQPQVQPQAEPQIEPQTQAVEPAVEEQLASEVDSVAAEIEEIASAVPAPSMKTLATLSSWRPKFASVPQALVLVTAAIGAVLLILVLSLYLHRRGRARTGNPRTQHNAPVLANATELGQEPQEIDEMAAQVASWTKQHPPLFPQQPPSFSPEGHRPEVSPSAEPGSAPAPHVDTSPSAALKARALEYMPSIAPNFEIEADSSVSVAPADTVNHGLLDNVETDADKKESVMAEIKKLQMVSELISRGDLSDARTLIGEIADSLAASLAEEQKKQVSPELAVDEMEVVEEVVDEEQRSPDAVDVEVEIESEIESDAKVEAEPLEVSAPEPAASPYAAEMARIERNKLELVREYLKLGDLNGARLLAQEVTTSWDADLRTEAEQILAKLPAA